MKRIVVMVIMMVMLWTIIGFAAPQWENVEGNTFVDVNSVKTVTVEYDEFAKGTYKSDHKNGGYTLMTLLINKDTKEWCGTVFEEYNADGKVTYGFTSNPKNPRNWNAPSDSKASAEILRLAN